MSEARDNAVRKFYEAGLMPLLQGLQQSARNEKREALMAFRPSLWGLHIWINGDELTLMDEKGFLCTLSVSRYFASTLELIKFESRQGPGSLRLVLEREVLDPQAAVQKVRAVYNPKAVVPIAKAVKEDRPLRRRKLSPADFAKLLGDI
jgi:hypothetical protein